MMGREGFVGVCLGYFGENGDKGKGRGRKVEDLMVFAGGGWEWVMVGLEEGIC